MYHFLAYEKSCVFLVILKHFDHCKKCTLQFICHILLIYTNLCKTSQTQSLKISHFDQIQTLKKLKSPQTLY